MPYSIGSDKLEKAKPADIKLKLTMDEERRLTGDMRELYNRLLPTSESKFKRKKFVQKLEKLLNDEWPGHQIRVHMFGSSGNLLCTDESDGLFIIPRAITYTDRYSRYMYHDRVEKAGRRVYVGRSVGET
jgi:DNA polymerase sigma